MIYVLSDDYEKVKNSLNGEKVTVVEIDKVVNLNGIPVKLYKVNDEKSRRMDLGKTLGGDSSEHTTD